MEAVGSGSTSLNRYIPLMSIFYVMIRVGSKGAPDSLFTALRTLLSSLRKIHVRYAMVASSDAVLLADSLKYQDQARDILNEVAMRWNNERKMVTAMERIEGSNRPSCYWTVMNALLNVKNLPKEDVLKFARLLTESDTVRSLDLNSRIVAYMQAAAMYSIRSETV